MMYVWIALAALSLLLIIFTKKARLIWILIPCVLNVALEVALEGEDGLLVKELAVLGAFIIFFVLFPLFKRHKSNADRLLGQKFILIDEVSEDKPGVVRVDDVEWTVVATKKFKTIPAGECVKVVRIDGVRLVVKKVKNGKKAKKKAEVVEPAPVEEKKTEEVAPVEKPAPVEEKKVEKPAPVKEKKEAKKTEEVAPVEKPAPVEQPLAPLDEDEEEYEEIIDENGVKRLVIKKVAFATKLRKSDQETKERYNAIKAYLLAYGQHDRLAFGKETFSSHRDISAVITIAGKTIKVYFPLNAADYENTNITLIDVSDKKKYEKTPAAYRLTSNLSVKRCKSLIDDVMKARNGVLKEVVEKDYAKETIKEFQNSQKNK